MTAPKRRWFRFSLRTLFLVVTMLGSLAWWLRWNVEQVHERQRVLNPGRAVVGQVHRVYPILATYTNYGEKPPPMVWRLLGATPVSVVSLRPTATDDDVAKLKRLFPEARVVVLKED